MNKKRHKPQWHRLDHAAKIFPVTSNRSDTKVFRFACQLFEPIVKEALQNAIYKTLEEYPVFRSVIKRGFFWYYLESSRLEPIVREEYAQPCREMFDRNEKRLLFEVTYYRKRINLEVYHALTDGTGALFFFRTLIMHYLHNKYEELKNVPVQLDYGASAFEKLDDSFNRYFDKSKLYEVKKRKRPGLVYTFRGARLSGYRLRIIEGTMPLKKLYDKAHEYHTTITVFLTALIICAISDEMTLKDIHKPVVIKVPVNLRSYFSSLTARNFFGIMDITYEFSRQSSKLEDVIAYVAEAFKTELTKEQLSIRMNSLEALEQNAFLRSTPLIIKDFFMKIGYSISNSKYTFSLSNVGNIEMPDAFRKYIDMFDVFLSTDKQQACICSYGGRLRISFTTPFESTQLQKNFFRRLSNMGIDIIVETNPLTDEQR